MTSQTPLMTAMLCVVTSLALGQTDVPGSSDHSLITRYPGSTIAYYEQQQFQEYFIATGPVTGYKEIKKWMKVEGRFTRIYYVVRGKETITEVFRNYLSAIRNAGFKELVSGSDPKRNVSKNVGGRVFLNTFFDKNPFPAGKGIDINSGSATSGGTCYLAAELQRSDGSAYLVLAGSQYEAEKKVFLLDIIEKTAMKDDLISVNADAILKGINASGKFVVYGIYFDFNKADVKPESATTLGEIAAALKRDPSLKLYIVGHTDMTGAYAYNLNLSRSRANAVVRELTTRFGIATDRLAPDGVGPLCPVAANENEEGRMKNRRVELVAR
ncbi:MAG: OmpA family protein [Ignavibacteriae bacterium]|nr:OmpA family protein [Ignavibacteriota bacterium]